MKKFILLFVTTSLAFTFISCKKENEQEDNLQKEISIIEELPVEEPFVEDVESEVTFIESEKELTTGDEVEEQNSDFEKDAENQENTELQPSTDTGSEPEIQPQPEIELIPEVQPQLEIELIPEVQPTPEVEKEKPLNHYDYWPLQAAYNKALDTADTEDDVKAIEDILYLYRNLEDLDSCRRVVTPILKIVKIYEESGRFADALRCYKMYRDAYLFIDEHTDENCSEPLKYADSFITHYSCIEPVLYTTAKNPADVPYYNAIAEPRVGTYSGMCGVYDESVSNAFLLYVQFGTESMQSFSYKLPKTDKRYVLELAWNTSDHSIECFEKISNGDFDTYIIDNLSWLSTLDNCDVLLRFGAEVNEWEANTTYFKNGRLDEFKKAYIDAFRHVSDLRKTYASNTAMVYSPNDISNMYVSHLDFYPGDEYVDWVGMSSYMNMSSNSTNTWGSMTDAYYSRGKYASQILKMKKIVDDFGDRKPIVVSESGFCYASEKSTQTQEHSAEKMRIFYSYLNMVFPQIKAVFYFNTNFGGNSYKLFDENGSSANSNSDVYTEMMNTNVPIRTLRESDAEGYTRITTLNEKRDALNLSLYASYPGNPEIKVTYFWDGEIFSETTVSPYHACVEKNYLTVGTHTLKVITVCKLTTFTKEYTVNVSDDGTVTVK